MIDAVYFTYDSVFSGSYGLKIADFDSSNVGENEAFSPTLTLNKTPAGVRFFHGGITYTDPLTYEFTIVSDAIIPSELRASILKWLVGRNTFKPLRFHSDELESYTYYCVFTNAQILYVNGSCHGFRLTATFDSPYTRGEPESVSVQSGTHTVTLWNRSDIPDGYVYPTITFTGNVDVVNTTDDSSRHFTFTNIPSTETITVDNETRIITTTGSHERLSNFTTKKWLRLKPGSNSLTITSSGAVTITCPWYAKIGV